MLIGRNACRPFDFGRLDAEERARTAEKQDARAGVLSSHAFLFVLEIRRSSSGRQRIGGVPLVRLKAPTNSTAAPSTTAPTTARYLELEVDEFHIGVRSGDCVEIGDRERADDYRPAEIRAPGPEGER